MDDRKKFVKVSDNLEFGDALLFITGAGISSDSGLPTYRGVNGLYENKTLEEGYQVEDILSIDVFSSNPGLTWKYLHLLEKASRDKKPNLAHLVIKELEKYFSVTVLTQNVDLLHQKARSKSIIPIHGTMEEIKCIVCGFKVKVSDYSLLEDLPKCRECTGLLRPGVVFFGESLDPQKIADLESRLNDKKLKAIFTIGTTSSFSYITAPIFFARSRGIATVEINPDTTIISSAVDFKIEASAAKAMKILREVILAKFNEKQ